MARGVLFNLRGMFPVVIALISILATSACHADEPYLSVGGVVDAPLTLSKDDFDKLPKTTLTIKESGSSVEYSGVSLADILLLAKVKLRGDLKGADVAKFLQAVGQDGFVAVFSLPEFDTGRFLIADKANDQSLGADKGPLMIVSPDENRKSRWVKHLVRLIVGLAKPS